MMVGRFLTSTVKNLTAMGARVITAMAFLSIVAIVLTGLAFAPIFPTIVGVTFAKFDSSQYGSIFGIIFAIGLLGGTFVPKWIGNLSATGTVQDGLKVAAVMAVLLIVVALALGVGGKKASA
jgi:fucose permease